MDIEERIARLEQAVTAQSEIIEALIGHDQALLAGLRVAITSRVPIKGSIELNRLLETSQDVLQGMPITDDALDRVAAARQRIAGVIHAALLQATFPPAVLKELRDKGAPL